MKKLTQSREDNCWQTCIAMLLDRDPGELPAQDGMGLEYVHPLRAYLNKHFDLTYVDVRDEHFAAVAAQRVHHLMIGETVRMSPEHDVWHATIGFAGEPFWDVHPSRAGLTKVMKWGLLVPQEAVLFAPESSPCVCQACTKVAS